MKYSTMIGLFLLAFGALNVYKGEKAPIFYIFLVVGFLLLFGGMILNAMKSKVSSSLAERADEKEFQKQLRRKAQEEEILGKARNKAHIELLESQTKALISQQKAGQDMQKELIQKYHELTGLGDSSYEYLKKEIRNMPSMKNVDFNL
jgi:uncharacterized protein YlxW (UPF0749 family)